jgi:hypothetical protein
VPDNSGELMPFMPEGFSSLPVEVLEKLKVAISPDEIVPRFGIARQHIDLVTQAINDLAEVDPSLVHTPIPAGTESEREAEPITYTNQLGSLHFVQEPVRTPADMYVDAIQMLLASTNVYTSNARLVRDEIARQFMVNCALLTPEERRGVVPAGLDGSLPQFSWFNRRDLDTLRGGMGTTTGSRWAASASLVESILDLVIAQPTRSLESEGKGIRRISHRKRGWTGE